MTTIMMNCKLIVRMNVEVDSTLYMHTLGSDQGHNV